MVYSDNYCLQHRVQNGEPQMALNRDNIKQSQTLVCIC